MMVIHKIHNIQQQISKNLIYMKYCIPFHSILCKKSMKKQKESKIQKS